MLCDYLALSRFDADGRGGSRTEWLCRCRDGVAVTEIAADVVVFFRGDT